MDSAHLLAIARQLDDHLDTVARLRQHWSSFPEPAMWSGPAQRAALGQLRSGLQRLIDLGSDIARARDECRELIEEARREEERRLVPVVTW
jgi:hypothetical protein